jgi:hypothetical protein
MAKAKTHSDEPATPEPAPTPPPVSTGAQPAGSEHDVDARHDDHAEPRPDQAELRRTITDKMAALDADITAYDRHFGLGGIVTNAQRAVLTQVAKELRRRDVVQPG